MILSGQKSKNSPNVVMFQQTKQARKSSEDAQAAGYAQFEKVWAGQLLVRKSLDPISRDVYDGHDHDHDHE